MCLDILITLLIVFKDRGRKFNFKFVPPRATLLQPQIMLNKIVLCSLQYLSVCVKILNNLVHCWNFNAQWNVTYTHYTYTKHYS